MESDKTKKMSIEEYDQKVGIIPEHNIKSYNEYQKRNKDNKDALPFDIYYDYKKDDTRLNNYDEIC